MSIFLLLAGKTHPEYMECGWRRLGMLHGLMIDGCQLDGKALHAMNGLTRLFTESHGVELLDALGAIEAVSKASEDAESDAELDIAGLFQVLGLAYLDECQISLSNWHAEFIDDTYSWISGNSDDIYVRNAHEKQLRLEYVRDKLQKGHGDLHILTTMSQLLIPAALYKCQIYDDSTGSSSRMGLARALTGFTYLLISIDNKRPNNRSRKAERYYRKIKSLVTTAFVEVSEPAMDATQPGPIPATRSEITTDSKSLDLLVRDIHLLIGLENIKAEVSDLVNLLRVQQMRKEAGLPSLDASHHMVFYGNPGTGKTLIARKLGEIFRVLGLLSKGHLLETDRAGLVGGYLGQTALKTKEVLERAKGGILFIDEAYALSQDSRQDSYGQEAIDTILKYMEDNRGDLVVIVAGYEDKMGQFIESNPGLKSRFNKYFRFADYSSSELMLIFLEFARQAQYKLSIDAQAKIEEAFNLLSTRRGKNFGNGRTVRNFFEKCVTNQANRVVQLDSPTKELLTQLLAEDICVDELGAEM